MARNAAGNNLGTAGNDFLWGKALVLGNGEYDNYVDMDSATVFDALRGYGGNDTIFGDIYYDGDDATEGDQIYGGDGDDVLYGDCGTDEPGWATSTNGAADVIYGDAGNDRIYGQAGGDNLYAGDGNDTIVGGIGSDNIVGGDGYDLIFVDLLSGLTAIAERNLALGGSGNDQIIGGWGNDELYGMDDQDKLIGGMGDDKIEGGDGADNMSGGAGNDYLRGGGYYGTAADLGDTMLGEGGNDYLSGEGGHDKIWGGTGNDTLDGGAGNDRLDGGTGADNLACGGTSPLVSRTKNMEGLKRVPRKKSSLGRIFFAMLVPRNPKREFFLRQPCALNPCGRVPQTGRAAGAQGWPGAGGNGHRPPVWPCGHAGCEQESRTG